MAQGLVCHQASLVGNGKVLITAGSSETTTPILPQLYDPVAGTFSSAATYANYPGGTNNCQGGTSTLLADGRRQYGCAAE